MRHDRQLEHAFAFGPFLFDPHRRALSREGRDLPLGSRARDILLTLLERAGETVPKRELLSRVWPGTLVEDGTLRVHITTLRRTLGDGYDKGIRYVESVTGLGYRFIAPVTRVTSGTVTATAAVTDAQAHTIPSLLIRMLGRDQAVSSLIGGLPKKRLMTIVGPGGIGKTTVAIAVAEQVRAAYADGVHYVDLQAISETGLVCRTIASVLGLATPSADPFSCLVAYTRTRKLLLVLDNCEHLIETAAQLVEQLLMGAPHINILVTSREPLRARGEWLLRLEPLELPAPGASLTASEALAFPAIRLFAERAHATLHTFALIDEDAAAVADICQRLDGLPLAIELAAARVDLFGVHGLAARLDDYLGLLTQGRRTAVARHQTLRATLDWSYQLLSAAEQQTLRRLAVFAGAFTACAAAAVVADAEDPASQTAEVLASLVAKSLLTVETIADQTRYRLLNISRAYALDKLESAGEASTIRRRHALLCQSWGEEASHDSDGYHTNPDCLRQLIEDTRAALDWCFAAHGDPRLGLELATCSAPLWFGLSFHEEYRRWVERALEVLPSVAPGEGRLELQLNAALGEALLYTCGAGEEVRTAYRRTLELAEQLGAVQDHWRAVWGLYVDRLIAADYDGTVNLAQLFHEIPGAADDLSQELTGERMLSTSHYLAGKPAIARHHAEQMLTRVGCDPLPGDRHLPLDHRVAMNAIVPQILWVLGFADQARTAADGALEQAFAAGHALTFCYTVAFVCPVLLWTGDVARARTLVQMLALQATSHSLGYWHCWATCLELGMRSTDQAIEAASCMELASNPLCTPRHLEVLATLRPELASSEVLARAERGAAGWCTPELLRIQAERIPRNHPSGAQRAETGLHRALASARSQGAHSWELRAAISLARLRRDRGRRQEACALLKSVLFRFVEGFDTPDLRTARGLLDELSNPGPEARAV